MDYNIYYIAGSSKGTTRQPQNSHLKSKVGLLQKRNMNTLTEQKTIKDYFVKARLNESRSLSRSCKKTQKHPFLKIKIQQQTLKRNCSKSVSSHPKLQTKRMLSPDPVSPYKKPFLHSVRTAYKISCNQISPASTGINQGSLREQKNTQIKLKQTYNHVSNNPKKKVHFGNQSQSYVNPYFQNNKDQDQRNKNKNKSKSKSKNNYNEDEETDQYSDFRNVYHIQPFDKIFYCQKCLQFLPIIQIKVHFSNCRTPKTQQQLKKHWNKIIALLKQMLQIQQNDSLFRLIELMDWYVNRWEVTKNDDYILLSDELNRILAYKTLIRCKYVNNQDLFQLIQTLGDRIQTRREQSGMSIWRICS